MTAKIKSDYTVIKWLKFSEQAKQLPDVFVRYHGPETEDGDFYVDENGDYTPGVSMEVRHDPEPGVKYGIDRLYYSSTPGPVLQGLFRKGFRPAIVQSAGWPKSSEKVVMLNDDGEVAFHSRGSKYDECDDLVDLTPKIIEIYLDRLYHSPLWHHQSA